MVWTVNVSHRVEKAIAKLDNKAKQKIQYFLNYLLPNLENPRQKGQALHGDLNHLWRYRVGDYRIICEIIDDELRVVAVEMGHRSKVYKQ